MGSGSEVTWYDCTSESYSSLCTFRKVLHLVGRLCSSEIILKMLTSLRTIKITCWQLFFLYSPTDFSPSSVSVSTTFCAIILKQMNVSIDTWTEDTMRRLPTVLASPRGMHRPGLQTSFGADHTYFSAMPGPRMCLVKKNAQVVHRQ